MKLPFVIKIFVLSIFEWPLKTGFTVFTDISAITLLLYGYKYFIIFDCVQCKKILRNRVTHFPHDVMSICRHLTKCHKMHSSKEAISASVPILDLYLPVLAI